MIYQLKVTMVYGAYMPEDETVERVFEADGSADLRDLIHSILNSLDFDFDHRYEFQVRKEQYSGSPMGAEGEKATEATYYIGWGFGDWIRENYSEIRNYL